MEHEITHVRSVPENLLPYLKSLPELQKLLPNGKYLPELEKLIQYGKTLPELQKLVPYVKSLPEVVTRVKSLPDVVYFAAKRTSGDIKRIGQAITFNTVAINLGKYIYYAT